MSSRFDENCSVCRLHLRKASPLFASFLPFSSRCFLWLSHVNVGVASITASMHRRGLTWLDFAMLLLSCLLLCLFTLLLCYLRRFCLFPLFLCVSTLVFTFHSAIVRVCPACCVCLSLSSILSRRFLTLLLNSLLSLATFSISLHLLPLRLFRVCASVDRARKPPATCPLPPLLQFAFPTSLPFLAFFHYYTVPPPSEREATAVTLSSSHHPTVQFIVAYSHISTHSLIVRWCKSWYAIRQLSWFICQGGRVWLPSSHPRGSSLPSSLQY